MKRKGEREWGESRIEGGVGTKHREYKVEAALSNRGEQNINHKDYRWLRRRSRRQRHRLEGDIRYRIRNDREG